jgi:hypothetical protein
MTLCPPLKGREKIQAIYGGYKGAVVGQESGANPRAFNKYGYAGLFQFGAPRAQDIGIYTPGENEPRGKAWSRSLSNAPGKWSGTFNIPGFPEVKTVRDFLDNEAAQNKAWDLHTAKMDAEISENGLAKYIGTTVGGVPITREAIHGMMHIGGASGAARFLRSGGTDLVGDANGKTTRDYAILANRGERTSQYALFLDENKRQAFVQQGRREVEAEVAGNKAAVGRAYEDSLKSAETLGVAPLRPSRSSLEDTYGQVEGARKDAEIDRTIEGYQARTELSSMGPAEQVAFIQSKQPNPNNENFAAELQRYGQLVKAADALQKQRDADPAVYVQTYSKAAGEAWAGVKDPASASHYATVAEQEQIRLGVKRDKVAIVPDAYISQLEAELTKPGPKGEAPKVAEKMKQYATLWGDAWGRVHGQLSKKAGSAITVLGSGVSGNAQERLPELYNQTTADVLKSVTETKQSEIREAVAERFLPFAQSLKAWNGGTKLAKDFIDQAEKYTAWQVSMGADKDTAAQKTFDELVGHKYDFRSTYRIPKDVGATPAAIESGARIALKEIDKVDLAPITDTKGTGTSEPYRRDVANANLREFGKWITSADGEKGLTLYYHDKVVLKSDGTPYKLTWEQLQGFNVADRAKVAAPPEGARGFATVGGGPRPDLLPPSRRPSLKVGVSLE